MATYASASPNTFYDFCIEYGPFEVMLLRTWAGRGNGYLRQPVEILKRSADTSVVRHRGQRNAFAVYNTRLEAYE